MARPVTSPFGSQISLRIALILLVLSSALGIRARAAEGPSAPKIPTALPGIILMVAVLNPDFEKDGFPTSQVISDVESRVRQAGIPVVSAAPAGLQILVNASKAREVPLYGFNIAVEFVQSIRLEGNSPHSTAAITWRKQAVGTVSTTQVSEVQPLVLNLVDEFIKAYLEQNPKN